jgi:DNA topoisomerase-1
MTTIKRLHDNGILRLGSAKVGFRYKHADGRKVNSADLDRIRRLKIPPAWKHVAINAAASGRVQVVAMDAAGRWQYLYHERHVQSKNRRKFNRLIKFGESLPYMRATVSRHLRQADLSQGMRHELRSKNPVNEFHATWKRDLATENGSYGITTLRPRHVTTSGDQVTFDFAGKSGVRQRREIRDRPVARIVRKLLKHSTRACFAMKKMDDSRP